MLLMERNVQAELLGRRLTAARKLANLSRGQVGGMLDVVEETVGRWERAESPVGRLQRQAFARACDVPIWFIEEGFRPEHYLDDVRLLPDPPDPRHDS